MTDFSNSATVQLLGAGGRAWQWAVQCVEALVSDLAGAAGASGRGPLLTVDQSGAILAGPEKNGQRVSLGHISDAAAAPDAIARQLSGRVRGDLTLRLGSGKAVVNRIALPAAAIDVLPAVVRNKVESLAPWPLAEALWGYRVVDAQGGGQAVVDVGIVSRATLDALLSALRSVGLRVAHLEIAGGDAASAAIPVDFLADDRNRNSRRRLIAVLALVAGAIGCVGAYGLYQAFEANQELSGIQSRIETLQQALLGKRGAAESPKLAAANQIYDKKRDDRPFVVLFNELTRLVPDGTWLTSLNFDGTRLTLSGHGTEIPKLVETLEKSETFSDVNFAAATQRDPDGSGETFSVAAGIRPRQAAP